MPLHDQLKSFDLTDHEARVYLACLELGPESVGRIAEKANLNRVTTYAVVDVLTKKGFLHEQHSNNKRRVAAFSPTKLYDIVSRRAEKIKRQTQELDDLVPQLKGLMKQKNNKTNIVYFEGEEGMKNWASDALETKGELLEWTRIESFTEPFEEYLRVYYFPEKFRKQIPSRFIFIDTPKSRRYVQTRYLNDPTSSPMKARFIPQELFDTPGFMIIFNDCFSIALPKEMRGVTVIVPLIADTQRKIFEFGWLHAKDEVQNKPYPKILSLRA
ncbi:hypothetical protein HZA86_02705 [Candidatus Uhrbacteria bacterium]|nr:hypothetical protein [Candidatus Uhrbacteria bacterium]